MTATTRAKLSARQFWGAAILMTLVAFALLEALINDGSPNTQDLDAALAPPSWSEPLGSDQFGRSMLARMGAALRLSGTLALLCVATSASIGVLLGVLAGWRAGLIDRVITFVVNVLLALPGLVLVLLLVALAPGSFLMLYVAISLVLWIEYFRVVRALTRSAVQGPAIQASRMLGFGPVYCFRRHVWPVLRPQVLTLAAFGAANSVLALAALGFISVGLRPPTAEIGLMMVELFPYYAQAPWILAQPLLAMFLLVLGCNLLAGVRE